MTLTATLGERLKDAPDHESLEVLGPEYRMYAAQVEQDALAEGIRRSAQQLAQQ